MSKIKIVLIGFIILVIGAAIGRFSLPAKIVEKTVVKTETKYVEVEKKQKDNNKVTLTTETIKPDGTKVIETKVVDKSIITDVDNKNSDSKSNSETDKLTVYNKPLSLSALVGRNFDNSSFTYGLHVEKQVVGPFSLGVWGLTDKTLGFSIGLGL